MTAGRRAVLSAALLGPAAVLAGPARAQHWPQRESHEVWSSDLSADRIKAALARLKADGGADPFGQMVKDHLLKNNPWIDPKVAEDLIRQFTKDEALMNRLKERAREQAERGGGGKMPPDDLAKFFREQRQAGNLPDLPDGLKGFGRPDDAPRPDDPPVVPKPQDPGFDPKIARPPVPNPPAKRPADPPAPPEKKDPINLHENPFGRPDGPDDPRAKSLDALAALWERNVGSLDQTPDLKRALFDLAGGENGFDFDLTDEGGNSFWDFLKNGGADGSSFGDLFDGAGGGKWSMGDWSLGDWKLPRLGDWGFGSRGGGGGGSSPPPRPSGGSSGGGWGSGWGSGGGIGGAWVPFVILFLVVLGVVVWLKVKGLGEGRGAPALAAAGPGGWPIDPRAINTREDVVKAFEYLSVLVCGPAARNWTHGAIADALAELARTGGERAVLLARLYELARYAPLDEPLTRAEVVEARALVCLIAGVEH
jgi:hypothetical protein